MPHKKDFSSIIGLGAGIFNKIVENISRAFIVLSKLSEPPPKQFDLDNLFEWPKLDNFEVGAVGESHYQQTLTTLIEQGIEHQAVLYPDDDNEYDNKAVAVFISGLLVGYLDRDEARSFRRRLGSKKLTGQATRCHAHLTGGHVMRNGDKASIGVALDIKPFY